MGPALQYSPCAFFISLNVHSIYIALWIMNISIGPPYEAVIKRIIERGYAGNQTEVIRQAILAYERMLEEEELMLVQRAVTVEVREIEAKKTPSHSFDEIKKILKS